MEFFKIFYYTVGLWFLIEELIWVFNPTASTQKAVDNRPFFLKENLEKYSEWDEKDKPKIFILLKGLIFMLWLFIGIFTYNGILFIVRLLLSFLSMPAYKYYGETNFNFKIYNILHFIGSLISVILIIFVIMNSFHLHIDLSEMLRVYLGLK